MYMQRERAPPSLSHTHTHSPSLSLTPASHVERRHQLIGLRSSNYPTSRLSSSRKHIVGNSKRTLPGQLSFLYRVTFDLCHSLVPDGALDLMDRMLTLDPSRRVTASEALQHPFLSGFDKDSIPPPV